MRYRRDVPRDDQAAIDSETEHVRDHLAAVADADDDPATRREDVVITVVDHVDGDPNVVSVIGFLNAEPNAPYLRPDYQPDDTTDGELPAALIREPMEVDDLDAHMARKAASPDGRGIR